MIGITDTAVNDGSCCCRCCCELKKGRKNSPGKNTRAKGRAVDTSDRLYVLLRHSLDTSISFSFTVQLFPLLNGPSQVPEWQRMDRQNVSLCLCACMRLYVHPFICAIKRRLCTPWTKLATVSPPPIVLIWCVCVSLCLWLFHQSKKGREREKSLWHLSLSLSSVSGHKVHWDKRSVNKTLTTQQETPETCLGYFNI